MNSRRERLAEDAHLAWSGWMHYLFTASTKNEDGAVTIPKGLVDRWERQMETPYSDLPSGEKASDRVEADEILSILVSSEYMDELFVENFNRMAQYIHEWARRKGFWEKEERNWGEMIALMHSELSEALETIREGNPNDDKIVDYSGLEAELADCIIRIMDTAAGTDQRVAEAIVAKMKYNEGREHKHGKAF